MDYIVSFLAAYGIVFALVNDKAGPVSEFLRRFAFFERMFECAFCTGLHGGWIVWILRVAVAGGFPIHFHNTSGTIVGNVLAAFLFSIASAAFCYAMDKTLLWLEDTTT